MTTDGLLSLDVGTQSVRALVFDAEGKVLDQARQAFDPPYQAPHAGWAEQDPEVYWRGIVTVTQALWSRGTVRREQVAGLALTTQRATVICVDARGQVLRPAMVWLDQRRCTQPPPMGAGWNILFALAGARDLVGHLQAQAEANWLAQHEPDIWRRTDRFLLLSGWLHHRLLGHYRDARAAQVGYLPFDYRRQQWAGRRDFKWRALAIRPSQLPELISAGQPMGGLSAAAAAALGLAPGLTVVASAADKACEVLGCGALAPDIAQLSYGTSATINTTQTRYIEVQRHLPAYPAALPGAWNTEIQLYRGFWMVSWFLREFAQADQAVALREGVPVETIFERLLQSVPPGSQGLVLQPYWTPGVREPGPEAKGAVIGFGDVHTRAHLYRALIEGLVFGLRAGKEQIERRLGHPLTVVRVSGGGSRSDAIMQITADILGQPVERPSLSETSALGAAINLAVGLGWYADTPTAVSAMTRVGQRFIPGPTARLRYEALYRQVYRPLYGRLRPLYQRIRAITGYPPAA